MKNCIASMAVALSLVASPVTGHAAPCWKEGQVVSLSGTITMKFVAENPDLKQSAYVYPLLHLDTTHCYADPDYGNASIRVAALIPAAKSLPFREGSHVTVKRDIEHTVSAHQPPETFMLFMKVE